jgi:hypothetical protein
MLCTALTFLLAMSLARMLTPASILGAAGSAKSLACLFVHAVASQSFVL